jgi:hypothetical protein
MLAKTTFYCFDNTGPPSTERAEPRGLQPATSRKHSGSLISFLYAPPYRRSTAEAKVWAVKVLNVGSALAGGGRSGEEKM